MNWIKTKQNKTEKEPTSHINSNQTLCIWPSNFASFSPSCIMQQRKLVAQQLRDLHMWEQLSRLGNILAMDPAWPGLGLATWVMKLGCRKQVRVRWELCVLLEYATHTQFKYSAYLGGDTGGMRISLISWSGIELGTEKIRKCCWKVFPVDLK